MRFNPGPGLGGHCIPLDPFYLTWKAREYGVSTRFIELAGEVNVAMPRYVVSKLQDGFNDAGKTVKGSRILLLGLAYKKNVDDPRESPAFELMHLLQQRGAHVDYHDPHIAQMPAMRSWPDLAPRASVELTPESIASYDCALIVTDHDAVDYPLVAARAQLIVDTRGIFREPRHNVIKA
jgi:UDP-N-acetyl-D-glucosamine dehydrogenase